MPVLVMFMSPAGESKPRPGARDECERGVPTAASASMARVEVLTNGGRLRREELRTREWYERGRNMAREGGMMNARADDDDERSRVCR